MSSGGAVGNPTTNDLVDRGARLFDYLAKAQTVGRPRVQDIAAYQRDGEVLWMADLPVHPAISYQAADPGIPFLMVQKVSVPDVPEPDAQLRIWLDPGWEEPDPTPTLRSSRVDEQGATLQLTDHSGVAGAFESWLPRWREWAAEARPKLQVQRLYHTMYEMYTRHQAASETLEAVLALGFLTWHSAEAGIVRRHLLTMPVLLGFDSDFGAISVSLDPEVIGYSAELQDILDTAHMSAPRDLERAETEARTGDIEPFDRENVGALVRMFINCINPDAEYFDELAPGTPGKRPTGRYAPAVILRRRGNRGMVTTLRVIAATIRESSELPAGIHNLVDPNYRPMATPPESSGAIVRDGKDQFLPLQLNQRQHEILEHVDHHAHTLVQGPPGTGKTHTAAALITHLLAQGKRVLITAHTDRALHEVRAKLPEDIKPLCVAVVGDSRQEHEDLKASINRISQAAADYHPDRSRQQVAAVEIEIDGLRAERARVNDELLALRERDVITHSVAGYTGTIAVIAGRWRAEQPEYGWISDLIEVDPDRAEPITGVLIKEWRALLLDVALDEPGLATVRLPSESVLPPVETFERWCAAEEQARHRRREFARFDGDPVVARCARLTGEQRARARELVEENAARAVELSRQPDTWVPMALNDIHNGRVAEWRVRAAAVESALSGAGVAVDAVELTNVQVAVTDPAGLLALAEALKQHIEANGPLRLQSDGSPKTGFATSRIVKDAGPLFEFVRIDGRIPVTVEQLDKFLNMQRAQLLLHQLDMVWPVPFPVIGQPRDRLARHRVAYGLLEQVLAYAAALEQAGQRLQGLGLPVPNWGNPSEIQAARGTFATVEAQEACDRAAVPFDELLRRLADPEFDTGPVLESLAAATQRRDTAAYQVAWARLAELNRLRRMLTRRAELTEIMASLPGLRAALAADPTDTEWDARLDRFDTALRWAEVGDWLCRHNVGGANELCRMLDDIEAELRKRAGRLAGITAWDRAVGRLTLQAQADLRQYAQLVKGLGKGKGAYAEGKKAGIQAALTNCRTAVPVWIMPIYRVVEQFSVTADMFDVVVVDEASQAGVEAVFLQYLAPRIVVIGDDKQVSPSAVGVDESELGRLAAQYLYDDRYLESWKNPRRSLFDDASMRYPKRITLVEHRRCVPEIIEFSNKIAYEREGVRLVPVRRYGSDRLDPIRTVHVSDGQESSRKINGVEAARIVDQIQQCLVDPRYDGKTFGVISLLGPEQAKYIGQLLVSRIGPEAVVSRSIQCGDAADFQGAERDVIFLSLVAVAGPDRRLVAQTTDAVVQRFNVAVSRARDQLWLFHSVTLGQLTNSADLRFQLLDYCRSVEQRVATESEPPELFPHDRVVEPFTSLFAQQVYNHIVDRGYRIAPHYTETGHPIDMVVTGLGGQVAIQCDDDYWSGPDQFREELDWQRDLERCDWPFHRIRLAEFVADPDRCLDEVWKLLEDNGIQPIGAEPEPPTDDALPDRVDLQGIFADSDSDPDADPMDIDVDLEPGRASEKFELDAAAEAESGNSAIYEASTSVVESGGAIEPYVAFSGTLESPTTASQATIVEDFVRIVAIEGPVTGARLRAAYVTAARTRERDHVRNALDRALRTAVRSGKLLEDGALENKDRGLLTYRLPEQPTTLWRELGPRKVEQVPPRELAEILAHFAVDLGWEPRSRLFRAVINAMGQTRLTPNTLAALESAVPLATQIRSGIESPMFGE